MHATRRGPPEDEAGDIFEESTGRFAERTLFRVKRGGSWQWMTYAEFREETDRVRAGLATLGVDKATASRRNVVLDRYAQEVEGLYG